MIASEMKALMTANGGSPSERAITVLIAAGMTCSTDIAEALGLTLRAVQMARQRSQLREASCAPEADCAKPASPPQQISPKSEASFATPPAETRARAYKESPSEINNTREGEPPAPHREEPHMSGKGFIISAKHDLYIPSATIDTWRTRFPALPDIVAKLERYSATLLKRGPMHHGWDQPAAWMVGMLADDNEAAAAKAGQAQLREQQIIAPRQAMKASRFGNYGTGRVA